MSDKSIEQLREEARRANHALEVAKQELAQAKKVALVMKFGDMSMEKAKQFLIELDRSSSSVW